MSFRDRIKELRRVPAASLVPHPLNWRRHGERQAGAVRELLRDVGWAEALVARELPDGRLELLDGHLRAGLAADAEVPVLVLDVDEAEARRLLLALDPLATLADVDASALRALSDKLGAQAGLAAALVADALKVAEAAEAAPPETYQGGQDAIPERPPSRARLGDVWALGRHRLAVGDARDRALLEIAAGGAVPKLMVADPPYSSGGFQEAQRAGGTWGRLKNDRLSSRGIAALLRKALLAAAPEAAYLFTDWRMWQGVADSLEEGGMCLRSMIVWDKGSPGMGGTWRSQHELVAFGDAEPHQRRKGLAAAKNVLSFPRERNRWHYTQKPVPVLRALLAGDVMTRRAACPVLDPFAGSFSLAHAAEDEGRVAVGIELDPAVADAALARWSRERGTEPTRLVEGRGQGADGSTPWPPPAPPEDPDAAEESAP